MRSVADRGRCAVEAGIGALGEDEGGDVGAGDARADELVIDPWPLAEALKRAQAELLALVPSPNGQARVKPSVPSAAANI